MSTLRIFLVRTLEKYPIIGNSIIYGTLCVAAETTQQTITKKFLGDPPKPYDTDTIGRYAIYGTFAGGPFLATWYRFLDKKLPGTATKIVLKKIALDQFIFTPQLLVLFYVVMSALERKPDLLEECREKFWHTFKANCAFWLPAQAINFAFVPPVLRVTYIGCCSFAWVNVLCWIKRQ